MSPLALALSLILAVLAPAAAVDTPSVLVKTETPTRGELPRIVTAFGATIPGPGASTAISVPYDGRVADLSVGPGQAVKTGDPLLRVEPSAAVLAAYDQARAALRLAQDELVHARQLRSQRLATRDQVAQAEKAVTDAQTQVDTLQRQGVTASGHALQAPFDGVVSAVSVGQGDRLQANAPLLTLVRSTGVVLLAGIEPADRSAVQPGNPVRMAVASGSGSDMPGKVDAVGGEVDAKSRLVPVRIARTDGQALIENQDMRADITVAQVSGWKLPRAAVLSDQQGAYVFQVNGGKAVRVNVRVLLEAGATVLVEGPVQAGRLTVTDGTYQLSDGMDVRTQ